MQVHVNLFFNGYFNINSTITLYSNTLMKVTKCVVVKLIIANGMPTEMRPSK